GIALWAAISGRGAEIAPRLWLAIVGIVGLLAGLVAFASPGLTALVLLIFIAGWAIVIGALGIWGAIELRKEFEGEVVDPKWSTFDCLRSFADRTAGRRCAGPCVGHCFVCNSAWLLANRACVSAKAVSPAMR